MTSPVRERDPLPSTDVPAISRHMTATLHQGMAADGILPATPRYAADGPVSMPQLSARTRDGVAVVSLHGELDSIGACILRTYLSELPWPSRARCVVDLTGLSFIDSICLGVLVGHCTRMRGRRGTFALAGPQPAVRDVLSGSGLLSWFEVYDTVEEAVAGTGERRPAGLKAAPAWHWAR
jgi:stage II sporulation protein AA (anti-sigma F factor antagonist)